MLHKILQKIDKKINFPAVKAHCDVPCGIYDPIVAQISALTVVRMIDLMVKLEGEGDKKSLEYANSLSRYIANKEEHAEMVKHEVRVIMGDMVKSHHLEAYPELHELVHKIYQLGSSARQHVNRDEGLALVESLNRFAEIFWKIKDVPIKRAKAPYAPNLELVYPAL